MSTWRSPRPAGSTFGMVVIPTIWLADNSVQVASDGPSAPTKGGARREATGRKRRPTSYGERTIARARRAKAQELVDRLVAEERSVLPTLMTTPESVLAGDKSFAGRGRAKRTAAGVRPEPP